MFDTDLGRLGLGSLRGTVVSWAERGLFDAPNSSPANASIPSPRRRVTAPQVLSIRFPLLYLTL